MRPGTAMAHLAAASTAICHPVPVNARYSLTGPAGSLRLGWCPTQPRLIPDLEHPRYFENPSRPGTCGAFAPP
jgi:hypothetical protein